MRTVRGYDEAGRTIWSENEEAGHARITKRGGLMVGCVTPGQFVATYKVGPAPEVRHEAALRAAATVRYRRVTGPVQVRRGKGLAG